MDGAARSGPASGWVTGGTIPGLAGAPAFALRMQVPSQVPVVIAVPHAGRAYPDALLQTMRNPGAAVLRLEDRYADVLAERVALATGAPLIKAQAPRAMIDLNRAPDDVDWAMLEPGFQPGANTVPARPVPSRRVRNGLGLIPRRLPGQGDLWRGPLAPAELDARIAQIHSPYHARIAALLDELAQRWGAALLIDLHSMPPLARERGESAQLVIGDRFGAACDGRLSGAAFDFLAGRRVPHAHNRPYAGGYGLERHANPQHGIHAVQIELDRSCYLDSRLAELGPGLEQMVTLVTGLVQRLAAETAELGQERLSRNWPEAAE